MKRGEVRRYRFGGPDTRRPVLILIRDAVLAYLVEVTVAPVTSTIRDIPSEVFLTVADGMPRECVANLDHIQTVSKAKIGRLITTVNGRTMHQVRSVLLFALGF